MSQLDDIFAPAFGSLEQLAGDAFEFDGRRYIGVFEPLNIEAIASLIGDLPKADTTLSVTCAQFVPPAVAPARNDRLIRLADGLEFIVRTVTATGTHLDYTLESYGREQGF